MDHQADNSEDEIAKTINSASSSDLVPTSTCPTCALVVPLNTRFCPNDGTALKTTEQGRAIPTYEFIKLLGSGGMGDVYEAEHLILRKRVAIKTLKSHLLETSALQRFQTEARAASSLKHPNIVGVYDCGVSQNGEPYMVMDLVQGETLGQVLKKKGSLSIEESMDIITQICAGVICAHEKGILHRDLKPSNVILEQHGQAKIARVLDFGIAKILEGDESVSQMTRTGELMGTPTYMSPEQVNGQKLDQRSDVYAVGCIFYEMLTGSPPILGKTVMETMLRQATEVPLPLSQAGLKPFPAPLEKIVARALAKDPAERFATLREMQSAIEKYRLGKMEIVSKPKARVLNRNKLLLASVLVAAALVVLAFAWYLLGQPTNMVLPPREVATPAPSKKPLDQEKPITLQFNSDVTFKAFLRKHSRDVDITVGRLGDAGEFTDITDDGLESLKNFYQLQSLNLKDCLNITAKGLKSLIDLPNLVTLEVPDTDLGDDALKEIAKMHLAKLNLARTKITDEGVLALKDDVSLADLNLKGTKITDKALATIAKMKKLKALVLDECHAVTDRGVAEISGLDLAALRLGGTSIADGAIKYILKIKNLKHLSLARTKVSDEGLLQLAKLKDLQHLELTECSAMSNGAIKQFHRLAPTCQVRDGKENVVF